ncbi:hypothetical protein J6590_039996 [Homalodisca vitripennis]|nr:hypothetical protein J6590_039996 [Homalodisca vitripennis]
MGSIMMSVDVAQSIFPARRIDIKGGAAVRPAGSISITPTPRSPLANYRHETELISAIFGSGLCAK